MHLLERTKAAGAVRADLDVNDLSLVFERMACVRLGDQDRTSQLPAPLPGAAPGWPAHPVVRPLPGPPPTWQELSGRWNRPANP